MFSRIYKNRNADIFTNQHTTNAISLVGIIVLSTPHLGLTPLLLPLLYIAVSVVFAYEPSVNGYDFYV